MSFDALECRSLLAAGAIQFSAAAYSAADSSGSVPIILTRTGGSTGAVSVKLATHDGTAISGTDYNPLSGSITFPDGVTTEKVNLNVLPDPVANLPGKTVNLTLSNPSNGASLGGTNTAVLTITHATTPGDRDGTFGTAGRQIILPGPTGSWAAPVSPFVIAGDGTSFAVSTLGFTPPTIQVNKYNPDGTPDTSYGFDGLATMSVPEASSNPALSGAVLQPDGKVLVGGTIYSSSTAVTSFIVARFNTDGTPDPTFGNNGYATLPVPAQYLGVTGGVTELADGDIVMTDAYGSYASAGLAVVAFGPDGSPSLTFGNGGIASTTLGPYGGGRPPVLAMPDGTFVVGGSVGAGGDQQMYLWRFNADGSLDTAFGSGGLAAGPAGLFSNGGLTLAPNGDIVQLGVAGFGASGAIAMYQNDGTLDTSFNGTGELDTGELAPSVITFLPNGQIVGVGVIWTGTNSGSPRKLFRVNPDGSLDTAFGINGYADDGGRETPSSIASIPGGKVLEGASIDYTLGGVTSGAFELDRYVVPSSLPTPRITWPSPTEIVAGTPLSSLQLDATTTIPGTFVYSPPLGTVLNAGAGQTLSVTFTPKDTAHYGSVTATTTITVDQLKPTISWPTPADITQGTALSAAQLDATTTVPGMFTYTPAAGTVLPAGAGEVLSVTFTPTDTRNVATTTAVVTINVLDPNRAFPTIHWLTPADIAAGTALGPAQLDATASVPGTFAYTPPTGTVLGLGTGQTLGVIFTPFDLVHYTTATASVHINVVSPSAGKAIPAIFWNNPPDVAADTALGPAQLNAISPVQGTFAYTPGAGTVLAPGLGQILSVTFTPFDTVHYSSATKSVIINVLALPITFPTPPQPVGGPLGVHTRKGLTGITLAFDESLDPASAVQTSLYTVMGGVKKKGKTVYTKRLRVKNVTYNPGSNSVTVNLSAPFKGAVQVTVRGGIMSLGGGLNGGFSVIAR